MTTRREASIPKPRTLLIVPSKLEGERLLENICLEHGSSIAVSSCYEHPEVADLPRTSVVRSKELGEESFELPLLHNSVVVFSLETNRRFKTTSDVSRDRPVNRWLGVTYRTSKTFIQQRNGLARFQDGAPLTSAEFYRLRRRENREADFRYPTLRFTLSPGDLL